MATNEKFAIKHLEKADYRIFIPESVNRLGFLILHIERNVEDMKITQLGYDPEKKANTLDVYLCAEEFQKAEQEECKRYIHSVVTSILPELEEPAMVSHKDHELYEEVNQKVTEFYERDEENHAVFLLLMDKKTEHIDGCILGERNNIMSGIAHSLRRDEKLLMDFAEVTQTLLLEGAIDALKEIKDKSKK